jgi:methyltransferase (TIGR00027 family)
MFALFAKAGTGRRASRTAEFMALFRALETARRPASARRLRDPLARGFLRPALRAVVALACLPGAGALLARALDRRWPGARTSAVARTRLIDDLLCERLDAGVEQVVILGAGFDARAYRLPGIDRARVFEIDHPATLTVKRARVAQLLGGLPHHVAYLDMDLDHEDLARALAGAGFDPTRLAFFLWEGVTNYLTAAAVDSVLRIVARTAAPASSVVFTYVHRGVLDGSVSFAGTEQLVKTLSRVGEPWTFGLDPAELPAYLAGRGLELVVDLGAREYRARYLGGARPANEGYEFYRVVLARVRKEGAPCQK